MMRKDMLKIVIALFMIVLNFLKSGLLSGWDTARLILLKANKVNDGLIRFSYGELSENSACLLGVIITLTPGTTLIDINTDTRELVLHLLDLEQKDKTIDFILRNFCDHFKVLNEVFA